MFGKQISPRIRFKHILNIILLSFNLFATIHYDTAEILSENEASQVTIYHVPILGQSLFQDWNNIVPSVGPIFVLDTFYNLTIL